MLFRSLEIFDASEEEPGVSDKRTAGFKQNSQLALAKALKQAFQVILHSWGRFVAITDAEPAAQIEMLQVHPFGAKGVDKFEHFFKRGDERLDVGNLRADMDIDSGDSKFRQLHRLAVKRERCIVCDAEFAFTQASGDVGVCLGIDVGVDAQ